MYNPFNPTVDGILSNLRRQVNRLAKLSGKLGEQLIALEAKAQSTKVENERALRIYSKLSALIE